MNNNAFVLVPIAQYLGVLHLRATIYNLLILVVGLIGYRVADAALEIPLPTTFGTSYQGTQGNPMAISDGVALLEQPPSDNSSSDIGTSVHAQKPRNVAVRISGKCIECRH